MCTSRPSLCRATKASRSPSLTSRRLNGARASNETHNWARPRIEPRLITTGAATIIPAPVSALLLRGRRYCLRGQCPACADRVCNAARTTIEENY